MHASNTAVFFPWGSVVIEKVEEKASAFSSAHTHKQTTNAGNTQLIKL